MLWAALVVLSAAVILLLFRLIIIRKNLELISEELVRNRESGYNRRLTVTCNDSKLNAAAAEINRTLDYQQVLKNDAERAERSIRESVSDIAHDLRTPMTVIRGNLQLIGLDCSLSEKSKEYLDICIEKTDTLKEMADGFFELSLLESDSDAVPMQRLNAVNEIAQFIAEHEGVIRQKGLTPDIILPEKTLYIMADRRSMTRMLENVLNNIIKYSPGSFRIKVEEEKETVAVCFSNPAQELKPEDAELLFLRTYRADRSRSSPGAGLGLYIVRLLAQKQYASADARIDNGELTLRLRFKKAAE